VRHVLTCLGLLKIVVSSSTIKTILSLKNIGQAMQNQLKMSYY